MADGLVRHGELGEVVAGHLGLDLNGVEDLSVVDTDNGTDHLGDDDHVTEVGLDGGGLLVDLGLLLGLENNRMQQIRSVEAKKASERRVSSRSSSSPLIRPNRPAQDAPCGAS